MNTLLVAVRSVHFASAILLFGLLAFLIAVAKPAWHDRTQAASAELRGLEHRIFVIAFWAAVVGAVSSAAWLGVEAAAITGLPFGEAIHIDKLTLILGNTGFGRVWVVRVVLVMAVLVQLLALTQSATERRRSQLALGAAAAAAMYLGSLAWAGHAAAGEGVERCVQIASDVGHLLAAGAWIGALPGLILLLGDAQPQRAESVTRRFSTLGAASVAALVLSGIVNAWYLVGDVPALFGTRYGQLLLAKLALFAAMIALAATNRWYLTPRIATGNGHALRVLRRNALLETAAGIIVVVIVGALGASVPAAHEVPIWPFDHTLSFEAGDESLAIRAALFVAGFVAFFGAGVAVAGIRHQRRLRSLAGLAGVVFGLGVVTWLLVIPAYPTTYMASPVRYSVAAIARGEHIYAQHCSECHGHDGRGDGPAATSLPIKPADLSEHASHHRDGNLFWWIAHGKPGTPMPAFSPTLTDPDVWNVIQFIRFQGDARDALATTDHVDPWRPIVAPDFTFERATHEQESLADRRERGATLVVIYTLPRSLARLRELAAEQGTLAAAGIRVVAVPFDAGSASREAANSDVRSILAIAGHEVPEVYAKFARRGSDIGEVALEHAEFLIDRQGYLRARWIGAPNDPREQTGEIAAQIEILNHERAHAAAPERHAH